MSSKSPFDMLFYRRGDYYINIYCDDDHSNFSIIQFSMDKKAKIIWEWRSIFKYPRPGEIKGEMKVTCTSPPLSDTILATKEDFTSLFLKKQDEVCKI